jgi:large subunit ribosomal protein LP0
MPQQVKKKGRERKEPFCQRLETLLSTYPAVFIVGCNNIGSHHMQKIKKSVKDDAVLVKGKNTLIRKAIRRNAEHHANWLALIPYIRGNVGLVFVKGDLSAIKATLMGLRVSAPAKVGILAPQDVIIEKGGTGLEPTKTSFLQALNIASKINRGQIDILQDITLIKQGSKVGSSESILLTMLGKKPFSYGLTCTHVYEDGKIYAAKFLDTSSEEVMKRFSAGLSTVAAISLATGLPTVASIPHSVLNAFKNLIAISLETGFDFDQAKAIRDMIDNPDAYKAPEATNITVTSKVEDKVEEVVEEVKEEKEESDDMGFSFFDNDE